MKFSEFRSSLDTPQNTALLSTHHADHSEKTKTLELILNITKSLNRTLILDDVLSLVLRNAMLLTHSDRGFIVLKNFDQKLDFAIGLNASGNTLAEDDFQISTTVVEDVFYTGLARFIEDAQSDNNSDVSRSILVLDLKTILCAPLIIGDKKIGVIYLDSKSLNKIRINEITYAFEILAGQAAIAIKNAQAFKEQIDMNKELVRVNNELNYSRLLAEKSSKFKTSLMRNLNHELRTPMNGILGLGGILRESIHDQEHCSLLDKILFASKRLLKTLTEILDLSDIESTTIRLNKNTVQVSKTIEKIAGAAIPQAKRKNLDFLVTIKNDFFIEFEERYFHQLLDSLVENALKFTNAGFIRITSDIEDGNGIIMVSDSGIGILEDQQETIFEAFRQASEGLDRSYEGCGLGLALVKKIVDLAGGKISVESVVGSGTAFVLTFPITKAPETYEAEPFMLHQILLQKRRKLRTPNILLVEDDEINLDTFSMFLNDSASLTVAENPAKAIRFAGQKIYDLVFIDIKLKNNHDGVDLMKQIKRLEGYGDIPFIATTGYTLHGDKERFLSEGFFDYLPKPFTQIQLMDIIKKNFQPKENSTQE